tara:strand:+ start:137 stop:376 length:240 start_codon:yes stop_codon:yes gene_type:complete
MKKIRHMKFSVRMEIDDSFDYMDDILLQDFNRSGWNNWFIDYDNPNQLELFDTSEYQTLDRFGRPFDKTTPGYIERTIK